ncbi:MAG TPA: VOC family protein [Candidatus Eremiobacteraceae bacterium]|nr:VOC family protein [Candidatus Eremiobacteraceae bacterium]
MATASKVGIKGIDTTMYLVKDVDRAKKFYTDLLGFEPTLEFLPVGVEWTFPTGETFGLVKPPNAPWEKSGGVHFGVEDIKAAVAECQERGIVFEDEAKIYETPGCFLAFALDTEGSGLILHQLKPGR